ncbi:MAG TPA: YncE family protein [Burkholderiaceae bacterium]|nr:YncE family protein [Burkholderiaceae bacterium]
MKRALITVQKFGHCLSAYDTADGRELARVTLPDYPHEFALDARRGLAYVGHYGIPTQFDEGEGGHAVLVVDVRGARVLRRLECGSEYRRIHGIAVDDAGRVFVLSETAKALLVFERPLDDTRPQRIRASGGERSHILAVSRDGTRAYSANLLSNTVTLIRPFDGEGPAQALATGSRPEGLALTPDESVLYVTHRGSNTLTAVDTTRWTVKGEVATGADPTRAVVARGGRVLVTHYGEHTIGVYGPDLAPEALIEVPAHPIAVGIDARDGRVYATLKDASVAVIDPETWRVERCFRVGAEPDGVALVDWT